MIYGEALDFDNIDNPLSLATLITFSSVRLWTSFSSCCDHGSMLFHKISSYG